MPVRLDLIAEPAEAAILTGDPRRAFHLAQELVEEPRMTHLARGLWGYGGRLPDGTDLTVQSTGSGGPAAVAVLADLARHGVRRVVRVGSCTAEVPDLALGDCVVVEKALAEDGSQHFFPGEDPWSEPDRELFDALAGAGRNGPIASRFRTELPDRSGDRPALAFDLQTAALFAAAREYGVRAAAVLVVSGTMDKAEAPEGSLEEVFLQAGSDAASALLKVT
jgi:purine-nucleoside phosphorylase